MPRIYDETKRQYIMESLLAAGLQALQRGGLKGMTIGALTKQVGIAQGTFYNFFETKEHLVYTLAQRYSEKNRQFLGTLVAQNGGIIRTDLKNLYLRMMLEDTDNAYRYLNRDDLTLLKTRLSPDYVKSQQEHLQEMAQQLQFVIDKRDQVDLIAVFNWIQLMNLCLQNKDLLGTRDIEESMESPESSSVHKMIEKLIDNMLDEIIRR